MAPMNLSPGSSGPGRWPKMQKTERSDVYKNLKEKKAGKLAKVSRENLSSDIHDKIASPKKKYALPKTKVAALGKFPVSSALLKAFSQEKERGENSARSIMFYSLDYLQNGEANKESMTNIDLVEPGDSIEVLCKEGHWMIEITNDKGELMQSGYLFPEISGAPTAGPTGPPVEPPEPPPEPPVEPAAPPAEPPAPPPIAPPPVAPLPPPPIAPPTPPVAPPAPPVAPPTPPVAPPVAPPIAPSAGPTRSPQFHETLTTLLNHELMTSHTIVDESGELKYVGTPGEKYNVEIIEDRRLPNHIAIKRDGKSLAVDLLDIHGSSIGMVKIKVEAMNRPASPLDELVDDLPPAPPAPPPVAPPVAPPAPPVETPPAPPPVETPPPEPPEPPAPPPVETPPSEPPAPPVEPPAPPPIAPPPVETPPAPPPAPPPEPPIETPPIPPIETPPIPPAKPQTKPKTKSQTAIEEMEAGLDDAKEGPLGNKSKIETKKEEANPTQQATLKKLKEYDSGKLKDVLHVQGGAIQYVHKKTHRYNIKPHPEKPDTIIVHLYKNKPGSSVARIRTKLELNIETMNAAAMEAEVAKAFDSLSP